MTRIVFIPGAWHEPTQYSALFAALSQEGYIVDSIANRTLNSTTATVSDDAAYQRELLLALIEADHDVVVVAHSYGGIPAGIAAAGLSTITRSKEGKKGGVLGLIYISSFIVPENTTAVDAKGGKPAPFIKIMGDYTLPNLPEQVFYQKSPKDAVEVAVKLIKPQATKFLYTSSPTIPAWKEADYERRKFYLMCLQDQALPPVVQKMMSAGWEVTEMDTDHSPFLSNTEETASWIAQKVQQLSK